MSSRRKSLPGPRETATPLVAAAQPAAAGVDALRGENEKLLAEIQRVADTKDQTTAEQEAFGTGGCLQCTRQLQRWMWH